MASNPATIITIELEDVVAAQLAQFCKRATFDIFYDLTEAHLSPEDRRERAYQMRAGIGRIQVGLARAGHAPR